MLQLSLKSRARLALPVMGAVGLLLLGFDASGSTDPQKRHKPADMTQRATAVYPAVVLASPSPAPTPKPKKRRRRHKPADMTLRATPVHPAPVAEASPKPAPEPTPNPKPHPKPTPAAVAAVAQTTPQPAPTPEPRRKHKQEEVEMTQRASAVSPVLGDEPKPPASAPASVETNAAGPVTSAHVDASPAPEAKPEAPPEPTPPAAQEVRRIGLVKVIGAGGTFLLIEARDNDLIAGLANGTELRCRGSAETGGAQTALLRVSPERRAPFIVADIVSGSPQVGDGVYLPEAASPPK